MGINTKVERMLQAIAIVTKDEPLILIKAIHDVINDEDGYCFDFIGECNVNKQLIKGRSYG